MNRRNFLTKLGIGAAACAVVPIIVEERNNHEEICEFHDETNVVTGGRCVEEQFIYDSYLHPQAYVEVIERYGRGFNMKTFIELNSGVKL